jgi:hypothetical protein
MKLTPVASYRPPRYPTHDYLLDHPELLRLVPRRWRGNRLVLAALGATTILLTSCKAQESSTGTSGQRCVAPIFHHGDGRSSFGCVAISPPVFLTEDEALQVITDEAKSVGLHFEPIPQGVHSGIPNTTVLTPNGNVTFDAFEAVHRIGIEFIPAKEAADWDGRRDMGTAGELSTVAAAENFRNNLAAAKHPPVIGIFYDPLPYYSMRKLADSALVADAWQRESCDYLAAHPVNEPNPNKVNWREHQVMQRFQSEYLLRLQVRDFIAWLKAEGVI